MASDGSSTFTFPLPWQALHKQRGANLQAQPLVKHDLSLDHDCNHSAGNKLEKRISLALRRVASGSRLYGGQQHQHRSELGQESLV